MMSCDCPHCWILPVYLTSDGEPAMLGYLRHSWALYYSPVAAR